MFAELRALEQNDTWSLTTLPQGKHVIGCKWVYKNKYRVDGTIEQYKAHLVAKGCTRTRGHRLSRYLLSCCQIGYC